MNKWTQQCTDWLQKKRISTNSKVKTNKSVRKRFKSLFKKTNEERAFSYIIFKIKKYQSKEGTTNQKYSLVVPFNIKNGLVTQPNYFTLSLWVQRNEDLLLKLPIIQMPFNGMWTVAHPYHSMQQLRCTSRKLCRVEKSISKGYRLHISFYLIFV